MGALRTPDEKADPERSWSRPDSTFFASGACHILAGAFLRLHAGAGFGCLMLVPKTGRRGYHVFVSRGEVAFDWRGYQARSTLLNRFCATMQSQVPGWTCTLRHVSLDPLGREFATKYRHRHPSEFLHDPIPRAVAYLRRFQPRSAWHISSSRRFPSSAGGGLAREHEDDGAAFPAKCSQRYPCWHEDPESDCVADVPALAALNGYVQALHVLAEPDVYRRTAPGEVEDRVREVLKQEGTETLLVEVDGEPAGCIVTREVRHDGHTLVHPRRDLYVDELVVAPSYRRQGLGSALMAAAAERARERNLGRIVLDVRARNEEARAFYTALGYAPTQLRLTLPVS